MLDWADRFNIFCFLDNQSYSINPHRYECLLGAGCRSSVEAPDFGSIDSFLAAEDDWVFGHLSYESKNSLHGFALTNPDPVGFPPYFFFRPQVLVQLQENELLIRAQDPEAVFLEINTMPLQERPQRAPVTLMARLTREEYLDKVRALQQHIVRGDCYEINFCQEFFAERAIIDPLTVFEKLTALSPNPFAALYSTLR